MHKDKLIRSLGALVVSCGMFTACAQPGPVLVQDILYQAPTTTPAQANKTTIAVAPFADRRGKSNSALGNRTMGDIQNDLVVQGTVAELVTAALKEALKARGIIVKDAQPWDIEKGPGPQAGADLLISGELKTFWVDVQSRPLNVQTKATVHLRVAAAEGADGKVVRTLNLNNTLSREDIAFSFGTVQETLSAAMSSALDQLLADEEVKKRLR